MVSQVNTSNLWQKPRSFHLNSSENYYENPFCNRYRKSKYRFHQIYIGIPPSN